MQNAVACAMKLQAGLQSSSLDFRIGINIGDIVDDGKDIHGERVWSQPASNLDEYDCFLRGHSIFTDLPPRPWRNRAPYGPRG